jgi:purine nucleosidase
LHPLDMRLLRRWWRCEGSLYFAALGLLFLLCVGRVYAQRPAPVIVDTDLGNDIDDDLAIALAIQSPELDVRAVTLFGDQMEDRMRLAWKELGLYGRRDIALGRGATEPLLPSHAPAPWSHFEILKPDDLLPPAINSQATSLIASTLLYASQNMTFITTGPLTNLALAMKVDSRIKSHIARIIVAGGAFKPPGLEYNIQADPIAAQIVFQSGIPITVVSRDVRSNCALTPGDLERLRGAQNPASQFLVEVIDLWQKSHAGGPVSLLDPVAVAVSFQPALIKTETGSVAVSTSDPKTFGQTRFEPGEGTQGHPAVQLGGELDARRFLDLLVSRLAAAPRSGTSATTKAPANVTRQ